MKYLQYLENKRKDTMLTRDPIAAIPHPNAKPHQADCLDKLLSTGKGAAFLDTGLGKTFLQIDWARHIPGRVLIVAPLAVAAQTIEEGKKLLGVEITYSKDGTLSDGITITNYERLDLFDTAKLTGVVLDESSILKGKNSKTKAQIVDMFSMVPYRLACTATPAPNDYTEIGNHAEFLGIMTTTEMLTRWFVHDAANTADWRLKGHAVDDFWQWVSSWAACVSKPSDLGHDDEGYDLPELEIKTHIVKTETVKGEGEDLFEMPVVNATSLHREKRKTIEERCALVSDMVNSNSRPWIVWCESNDESAMLSKMIPDAVEVKGSDSIETKESRLMGFTNGTHRVIVSKPSICGFGMNWQHCRDIAFASISYSYEKLYQAIRRSWRFGQTEKVNVHVVIADAEIQVWRSVEEKSTAHETMKAEMRKACWKSITGIDNSAKAYDPQNTVQLPSFLKDKEVAA